MVHWQEPLWAVPELSRTAWHREVTALHAIQGKTLPCMPKRSFDSKPFKRVYYNQTLTNILKMMGLKCGTLISFKSMNKLKICRDHLYWNLSIASTLFEKSKISFGLFWASPQFLFHASLMLVLSIVWMQGFGQALSYIYVVTVGGIMLTCVCAAFPGSHKSMHRTSGTST